MINLAQKEALIKNLKKENQVMKAKLEKVKAKKKELKKLAIPTTH